MSKLTAKLTDRSPDQRSGSGARTGIKALLPGQRQPAARSAKTVKSQVLPDGLANKAKSPVVRRTSVKRPVIMRGGVVYPIPSRKILDSMRKGHPNGEAIRAFRQAINLNVRDFARFIGVDPATVFRWETMRTGKLQLGSLSKVLKLVNSVASGKPIKLPAVFRASL
ncbi:MAG: helix-turn-helix domain-containing protein [Deltaproteobacteria bacterium]|jgi:hypothetical protein|nr:helix-turn-helix domain-containing protein [Deltaproteobacteria bacterium]